MKKTTGDALQDLKVRPSCSYYLLSGILSSFVWDLDIMQMQLRCLLQLLKCQNVFSELRLTDTIYLQSGLCEQKCKYETVCTHVTRGCTWEHEDRTREM